MPTVYADFVNFLMTRVFMLYAQSYHYFQSPAHGIGGILRTIMKYILKHRSTNFQKRDYKGLYRKFSHGKIKNVAGMDIEFIPPDSPDLIIQNNGSLDNLLTHENYLSKLLENSSP